MKNFNTSVRSRSLQAVRQGRTTAFIDGINLHKGVLELGWRLDYRRFKWWLSEKFLVNTALIFVGYVPKNQAMYRDFENWGYSPVFRPISRGGAGHIKGNCDTDLAISVVSGCYEDHFDKAVIVSGDGDFAPVTSFLANRGKLRAVVAPSYTSCSKLLGQTAFQPTLIEFFRNELEYPPQSNHESAAYHPCRNSNTRRDCETLFRDSSEQHFDTDFVLPA